MFSMFLAGIYMLYHRSFMIIRIHRKHIRIKKNFSCRDYFVSFSQRITISIIRKFVSCKFSMDQLDVNFFGGDDLSLDTYPTNING